MAGTRRSQRTAAQGVKYTRAFEDTEEFDLPEGSAEHNDYEMKDAIVCDTDSDPGEPTGISDISDAESIPPSPPTSKKRTRNGAKKIKSRPDSKSKQEPILISDDEEVPSPPRKRQRAKKGEVRAKSAQGNPKSKSKPVPSPKTAKAPRKPRAKKALPPQPTDREDDDMDVDASTEDQHAYVDDPLPVGVGVKTDPYKFAQGIKEGADPLVDVGDMIRHLVLKMIELGGPLQDQCISIKAGTVCSGTDIPILLLDIASKFLKQLKSQKMPHFTINLEHMFSAEIVAWKQAFIQRNFNPPFIFRDITEFFTAEDDQVPKATTAFGSKHIVPSGLTLLVGGFCCVDFSPLNSRKKSIEDGGESGDTFRGITSYMRRFQPSIVILENVVGAPWLDNLAKVVKSREKAADTATDVEVAKLEAKLKEEESGATVTPSMKAAIWDQQYALIKEDNVPRGIDWHLRKAGYRSRHLIVDTKDYCIPQTRQRGYLVAISVQNFKKAMRGATDEEVEDAMTKALNQWTVLMEKFKSPASVPVEAMLVATEDDSQPAQSRVDELDSDDKKETPWVKCKLNHVIYRQKNGFGNERKLTFWAENGFRNNPDHWSYLKGMTDRVADCLEISHLRCIVRGLDDRYYSRYLELSQNVYRVHDSTKNGLIGCLTPSGIPYWTYRGRRITGREALVLQGLPVNMLDLSHLTDAHLQNFSGNAMSSTVVAAAMFSALIAFQIVLPRADNLAEATSCEKAFEFIPGMEYKNHDPTAAKMKLSVDDAMRKAAQTVTLCQCEGRHHKFDKIFLRCKVCHHTGCKECTGNPTHSFEFIDDAEIRQRELPSAFQTILKNSLPTRFQFSQLGDIIKSITKKSPHASTVSWAILSEHYNNALNSDLLLKKFNRGGVWEVTYRSPYAKLVLSISGNQVQWLLYALPLPNHGLAHPVRVYLEAHPIARLIPVGDDITQGDWKVFVPDHQLIEATITSRGKLIPAYESWIGLEDHQEQYVFDRCSVVLQPGDAERFETDISGDYQTHQRCGQAFGSLHVKSSTKNDPSPLFFFLDHIQQRGDPWTHPFVFTHDPRRQKPVEQRSLIAQLAPYFPFPLSTQTMEEVPRNLSWRQPKVQRELVEGAKYQYKFRVSSETSPEFELIDGSIDDFEIVDRAKIVVQGSWMMSDLSMNTAGISSTKYQHITPNNPSLLINSSCQELKTVFMCQASIPDETQVRYTSGEIITLDPSNQVEATSDFLWILQSILSIPGYTDNDHWHSFPLSPHSAHCQDCAPDRPQLLWAFNKRKKALKQEPYEDPQMAATYERSLKNRPKTIEFQFVIIEEKVNFRISINFQTLVHRAIFDLEPSGQLRGINATVSLVTNDDFAAPLKPFTPFIFPASRKMKKNFKVDDLHEFKQFQLTGKLKLRPEQCRSVAWQIKQERTRPNFEEEIIVEEQSKFGYRASAKVSRLVSVGGGCLFHPVGFGKTAVTLALIANQEDNDEARAQQASQDFSGHIPLKATLIVMPPTLTGQWREEIDKFLNPKVKKSIIVIATMAKFNNLTIKDLREAWIVIVNWKVFETMTYIDNLAQFAGMVGPDAKISERAYTVLHRAAMARIAKNVDLLRSNPSKFCALVNEQITKYREEVNKNVMPVPSRRVTGCRYQNAASRSLNFKRTSKDVNLEEEYNYLPKGPQPNTASWESTKGVPLEAFNWARVVADEFTYMTEPVSTVVTDFVKKNLWLISATPGLDSFEKVRQLAAYFGVNLGIKDFTLMKSDMWKKDTVNLTVSETFLIYGSPKSWRWYSFREGKGQDFIDLFSICDQPSYDEIDTCEVIRVSHAPAAQMAASKELMQCLAVTDKGALPRKPTGSSNQDKQLAAAFSDSKTAVQALMKQASFFNNFADLAIENVEYDHDATSPAVNVTVKCRAASLAVCKKLFYNALERIVWLSKQPDAGHGQEKWRNFRACLKQGFWGDEELCIELQSMISVEEAKKPTTDFLTKMAADFPIGATTSANGKVYPLIQATLRDDVSELTKTVDELLKRLRAFRYMEAVENCQRQSVLPNGIVCTKCRSPFLVNDMTLLTGCGHLVCNECIEGQRSCPLQGCNSGCESYSKALGSIYATPESSLEISRVGQKAEDLVLLINEIPPTEKALLFVQSEAMIKKVIKLFKSKGISHAYLDSSHNSQKVLGAFQKGQGNEKVLIMNIASESAAGCNLAIASHVIFFAPYQTTGSNGQTTYESNMKQAIGRAVRYGQRAPVVKIYHFMTAYTVDIDIFEHRNKQLVAYNEVEDKYERRPRDMSTLFGELASCVPHLVHAAGGVFNS